MNNLLKNIKYAEDIKKNIIAALQEDIRDGDITAELISNDHYSLGKLITRDNGVIAGITWFNKVYSYLNKKIKIKWLVKDGDEVRASQTLCNLSGNTRDLLTGERSAINFLQTLSATATQTKQLTKLIAGTKAKLLDTRKTIPGLRTAQKYAVVCGKGTNHRLDLNDRFLIKENHIQATGSITQAVETASQLDHTKKIEVEVTNIMKLSEAITTAADIIMLDNFKLDAIKKAVAITPPHIKLEVSGNVTADNILAIAQTGVDYIAVGSITKNCYALDLSLILSSKKHAPNDNEF